MSPRNCPECGRWMGKFHGCPEKPVNITGKGRYVILAGLAVFYAMCVGMLLTVGMVSTVAAWVAFTVPLSIGLAISLKYPKGLDALGEDPFDNSPPRVMEAGVEGASDEGAGVSSSHPLSGQRFVSGRGELLELDVFRSGDVPVLMRVTRDPGVAAFTLMPELVTEAQALDWVAWAAGCPNRYAIRDADGGLVGQVGHVDWSGSGCAEIFYWVDPEARNRGIGTSALAHVTSWVEVGLGFTAEVRVDPGNDASLRVAERCGYTPTTKGDDASDGGATLLLSRPAP